MSKVRKHLFLSYCRDDAAEVARLQSDLTAAGEQVWWDQDIDPGADWKNAIRQAMKDSYAVVVCLSHNTESRLRSGIYPELYDAIATYREYSPGSIYLIPVKLNESEIPLIEIDATRTLDRLQHIELFPESEWDRGVDRLVKALRKAPYHP